MKLSLLPGRAHPDLATAIGERLGIEPAGCRLETFPDGELHFRSVGPLLGRDVFCVQPTSPPASPHLLELMLMADGCRRAGAARITAVVPYFGYARQDRRTEPGEAVGARLVADLLATRFDRIITLDLHKPSIEGFFAIPVEHLSAGTLLAEPLKEFISDEHVLVAPDLGAVKRVQFFADLLDAPVAYVHKERFSGDEVRVRHITGHVRNRIPVLIDDMISTGGTIVSALEALMDRGCRTPATVVAVHALLVGDAAEKLAARPVAEVIATNSIRRPDTGGLAFRSVDVAGLLAETVKKVHTGT
ncbi:MAG TPA: ribose-phosphate diphosphokinase [Desulfobacterales bacterium]